MKITDRQIRNQFEKWFLHPLTVKEEMTASASLHGFAVGQMEIAYLAGYKAAIRAKAKNGGK